MPAPDTPDPTDSLDALFVDADGKVGISTSQPKAALDVEGDVFVSKTVTAESFLGNGSNLSVFVDANLLEALDAKLDNAGGTVSGPLTVGGDLTVTGITTFQSPIVAPNVQSTNLNQYSMYPSTPEYPKVDSLSGAVIYQDIFEALNANAIANMGLSPPSYNDTRYKAPNPPWNHRELIMFGGPDEGDGHGAMVTVPNGCDTVWIRVCGERWNAVHAYVPDSNNAVATDLGVWLGGYRGANSYCPDGSLDDGAYYEFEVKDSSSCPASFEKSGNIYHQWLPIYVGNVASVALVSTKLQSGPASNGDLYLSGLAFTTNPWTHAVQSAMAFGSGLNGGDRVQYYGWFKSDIDCSVAPQSTSRLRVPFVKSGRDKLLYVVARDSTDNSLSHDGVLVNGTKVGRLRASFDNPFARHWNSKVSERYVAVIVPDDLVPASGFQDVQIDMTHQSGSFYFREVGTHGLETPIS
jgi:hypothetical protein